MVRNPTPDEFNGSGFYLVAIVGALVWGSRDLVALFTDEYLVVRAIAACYLFQVLEFPFDQMTSYMHKYFVQRFGTLAGVVLTMVLIALTVRGCLMLTAEPHRQSKAAENRVTTGHHSQEERFATSQAAVASSRST